ncbi:MAG: ATPase [Oscillospiraceae bacterium]|jgi:tRNA uridine 5-carbamoylmethylation protein Kti12|nr:ATPase [Oscillospiraceae bacterium]
MKKLILVTSPPACGKTYISKQLATNLKHVVYLDKDTLIVLSKQIFVVAGEEYNRSSDFFEKNIRDYEYDAIVDIALAALEYDDIVLINAPFTKEVRDINYMNDLRKKLEQKSTKLIVIWVETDIEVCKQRMIQRNSDRDKWKLANWEKYISGVNFNIPRELDNSACSDDLLVFKNSTEEQYDASMREILHILES